ncbi:uncharacterized protein [Triticum aestivum]|uniref:uncharacterized protein n=2 Tax=Triticum TaxID=4564 RepID=UPI001D009E98|nr:uncharacterized protein LOC123104570 [Triticum aestivum]
MPPAACATPAAARPPLPVSRRCPLQPRDGNAAASLSLGGAVLAKSKAKAPAAAASPPSVRSYAARVDAESRAAAVAIEKKVSLAEELEKVRERRGRVMAELIRLIEMQSQLSVFGGETLKLEIQWSDFPVEGIREVYSDEIISHEI